MARQAIVVQLEDHTARQLRALLNGPTCGYLSLEEFVETAIRNQLSLESSPAPGMPPAPTHEVEAWVAPLPAEAPLPLALPRQALGSLSVLTNRLGPLKIAIRVLGNFARRGRWPEVKAFQEQAA